MDLEIFRINVRICLRETFSHSLQFSAHGVEVHTRFRVRHQRKGAMEIGYQRHWHVDIRIVPGEAWRDNAEDGVRLTIELYGLARTRRAAVEVPLPEEITDDGDARRSLHRRYITR